MHHSYRVFCFLSLVCYEKLVKTILVMGCFLSLVCYEKLVKTILVMGI